MNLIVAVDKNWAIGLHNKDIGEFSGRAATQKENEYCSDK